ncbi:hypothetical protein G9A89_017128 [Geosiphon pyriformis]|nr:hypothetical protein G9A89_017128 [Geosiphon pyriformis]
MRASQSLCWFIWILGTIVGLSAGHLGIPDNEHVDALAKETAFSTCRLFHLVSKRFLKIGGTVISGNSRHFVYDVFCLVHYARWEVESGSWVVADGLCADINWSKSSLVWHPNSHLAAGFTSVRTAGFQTYFMKAFHRRLPVAVHKHLYNRGYPSVMCLYCGDVEISDHVFSCSHDITSCVQLLDVHASAWMALSGLFWFSSCVLQLLNSCVSKYHESVLVFKDSEVGASKIVNFVCGFCLAFWDDIWLVHTRHRVFIEKHSLIPHDGSTPASVSGLSMVFSAGVVRLLGVAEAFGVGFGFYKFCPFFLGIGDLVSVHISI